MIKEQNGGSVRVLDLMEKYLNEVGRDNCETFDFCEYIIDNLNKFVDDNSDRNELDQIKPIAVMIDDISILQNVDVEPRQIYRLFYNINNILRARSKDIPNNKLSHFIVQTAIDNNQRKKVDYHDENNYDLTCANMGNLCDLHITLRPLETGYSTRVDGTIKIVDNRLPSSASSQKSNLFSYDIVGEVGTKKAYFFKLGDRTARLTSSALIF